MEVQYLILVCVRLFVIDSVCQCLCVMIEKERGIKQEIKTRQGDLVSYVFCARGVSCLDVSGRENEGERKTDREREKVGVPSTTG